MSGPHTNLDILQEEYLKTAANVQDPLLFVKSDVEILRSIAEKSDLENLQNYKRKEDVKLLYEVAMKSAPKGSEVLSTDKKIGEKARKEILLGIISLLGGYHESHEESLMHSQDRLERFLTLQRVDILRDSVRNAYLHILNRSSSEVDFGKYFPGLSEEAVQENLDGEQESDPSPPPILS
ncbi:hypothetical protein JW796_04590 [Candidatus Dojkabacteria bacterium]|nr:hypothetical protein [Candidatus Dojkabacteria bacterium]